MPKLNLTLERVLNDQRKAQHFYRYAKKLISAENLDFLFACRQLNPGLGVATFKPVPLTTTTQGAAAAARYIYDRFILATGNHPNRVQVNIKSSTKQALVHAVTQGTLGMQSFNQAYADVLEMVRNETWKTFAIPTGEHLKLSQSYWDNGDLRGYVQS